MLFLIRMLLAVELNDQPCFDAAEIHNERIDSYLSAEFPAVELSVSEDRPEMLFGFGGIATERARTSERLLCDESGRREIGHWWTISLFGNDGKLLVNRQ